MKLNFVCGRQTFRNDRGEGQIELYLYHARKKRYLATGYFCKPADFQRGKVTRRPDAVKINNRLNRLRREAEDYYDRAQVAGNPFHMDSLLDHLREYLRGSADRPPEQETFCLFVRANIELMRRKGYARGYLKNHQTLLSRYLEKYDPVAGLDDLSYLWLSDLVDWLFQQPNQKYPDGKLSANYVGQQVTLLKVHVSEAVRQGKIPYNPFSEFSVQREKTRPSFLTIEEVDAVAALDLTGRGPKWEFWRKWFVVLADTGLRYIDSVRLERRHISETSDGAFLRMSPQKTGRRTLADIALPLRDLFNGRPERILVELCDGLDPADRVFPGTADGDLNRYFREIGRAAGIDSHFTVHSLRHSFGVNMLNEGYPIEVVSRLMAHSDIKTTQMYAHLTDQGVVRMLRRRS